LSAPRNPYGVPYVAPAVGMAATVCIGSDRYPATVTGVVRPRDGRGKLRIVVRLDGTEDTDTTYIQSREQEGVYNATDRSGRRAYVGRADSYLDPHV
jgi:hypothetical protein